LPPVTFAAQALQPGDPGLETRIGHASEEMNHDFKGLAALAIAVTGKTAMHLGQSCLL
jgi:hypothetical protein